MPISSRFKADIMEKEERTMSKRKSPVSFKNTVHLSLRGLGIWWRENPCLLLSILICGIIEALSPYVDIWLLARLIDEIAGARDQQQLTVYVLALSEYVCGIIITLYRIDPMEKYSVSQHSTHKIKYSSKTIVDGFLRIWMTVTYRNFDPRYGKIQTQGDGDYINLYIVLRQLSEPFMSIIGAGFPNCVNVHIASQNK